MLLHDLRAEVVRRHRHRSTDLGELGEVVGTHLCIGTHVARASLAAVFGQLAQRATDLRVVTEPDVEPNIFARAVRRFDLAYRAR